MLKTIFRLAILLVIGVIVYNYFYGSPEEKATSEKIFSETKDLVGSVYNLIKQEKEKFDEGKYDNILDKLGNVFENLKQQAEGSAQLLDQIQSMEAQREKLAGEVAQQAKSTNVPPEEIDAINEEIDQLTHRAEELLQQMEAKEK